MSKPALGILMSVGLGALGAACRPPAVPATSPIVRLHKGPTQVPDAAPDYDYEVRYEWANDTDRNFHLINEHACRMMRRIGDGPEVYSVMRLAELWPLDARGIMIGPSDHIYRGGAQYSEVVECCDYRLVGIMRTSGKSTLPGAARSVPLGASTHAGTPTRYLSTWVAQRNGPPTAASNDDNAYRDFRQNPPMGRSFTYRPTDPPRETVWSTEYRLVKRGQDAIVLRNVTDGHDAGDPSILHGCDFPAEVQ